MLSSTAKIRTFFESAGVLVRSADVSFATSRRHPSEDNAISGQFCPVFQCCPHCCRASDGTGSGFGGKGTAHEMFIGHATHVKMREVQVCHVCAIIKHIAHIRHIACIESIPKINFFQ